MHLRMQWHSCVCVGDAVHDDTLEHMKQCEGASVHVRTGMFACFFDMKGSIECAAGLLLAGWLLLGLQSLSTSPYLDPHLFKYSKHISHRLRVCATATTHPLRSCVGQMAPRIASSQSSPCPELRYEAASGR